MICKVYKVGYLHHVHMYIKKHNQLHSFVFAHRSHPDPQPQIPSRDDFKCLTWLVVQADGPLMVISLDFSFRASPTLNVLHNMNIVTRFVILGFNLLYSVMHIDALL